MPVIYFTGIDRDKDREIDSLSFPIGIIKI